MYRQTPRPSFVLIEAPSFNELQEARKAVIYHRRTPGIKVDESVTRFACGTAEENLKALVLMLIG
jgi:hypothetical protein